MGTNSTYFIIENKETQEKTYIMIKNLIRFRRGSVGSQHNPEWAKDKIYLQFIHRDDHRVGYFLTQDQWDLFQNSLPYPPRIFCVNPPNVKVAIPLDPEERIVTVNPENS